MLVFRVWLYLFIASTWSFMATVADDPWSNASSYEMPLAYTGFGVSVGINDNFAIVGATQNLTSPGYAYIYARNNENAWTQLPVQILKGNNASYGKSVAISTDWAAVGAPSAKRVSIYRRNPSTNEWDANSWAVLDNNDNDFGDSIAMTDDFVVVGSYSTRNVYIYIRNGLTWSGSCPSLSEAASGFGKGLAIGANFLAVGAKGANKVFVYDKGAQCFNGAAIDVLEGGNIGEAVAFSPTEEYIIAGSQGSKEAFFWQKNGSTGGSSAPAWHSNTVINGAGADGFGQAVSIGRDYAVVGSGGRGAYVAYLFALDPSTGTWGKPEPPGGTFVANIAAQVLDEYTDEASFGQSVAITSTDSYIAVGAPLAKKAHIFQNGSPNPSFMPTEAPAPAPAPIPASAAPTTAQNSAACEMDFLDGDTQFGCDPGQQCTGGGCQVCPRGYFCPGGASESSEANLAVATPCAAGRYQDQPGQSECPHCPAFFTSPVGGTVCTAGPTPLPTPHPPTANPSASPTSMPVVPSHAPTASPTAPPTSRPTSVDNDNDANSGGGGSGSDDGDDRSSGGLDGSRSDKKDSSSDAGNIAAYVLSAVLLTCLAPLVCLYLYREAFGDMKDEDRRKMTTSQQWDYVWSYYVQGPGVSPGAGGNDKTEKVATSREVTEDMSLGDIYAPPTSSGARVARPLPPVLPMVPLSASDVPSKKEDGDREREREREEEEGEVESPLHEPREKEKAPDRVLSPPPPPPPPPPAAAPLAGHADPGRLSVLKEREEEEEGGSEEENDIWRDSQHESLEEEDEDGAVQGLSLRRSSVLAQGGFQVTESPLTGRETALSGAGAGWVTGAGEEAPDQVDMRPAPARRPSGIN